MTLPLSIKCGTCGELVIKTNTGIGMKNMSVVRLSSGVSRWFSRDLQAVVHECWRRDGQIEADINTLLEMEGLT